MKIASVQAIYRNTSIYMKSEMENCCFLEKTRLFFLLPPSSYTLYSPPLLTNQTISIGLSAMILVSYDL